MEYPKKYPPKYPWIEEYCLSKKGAQKEVKMEWGAVLYKIGGKMFGLLGKDKEGNEVVTLKAEPEDGVTLRERYAAIRPGYYMNKVHWNSVCINLRDIEAGDESVPDEVLKKMIDRSYELVLRTLSQKVQKGIEKA